MNRQETLEAIAVMQAFADGKSIQYRMAYAYSAEWRTTAPDRLYLPSWDWRNFTYRITPEKVYIVELTENQLHSLKNVYSVDAALRCTLAAAVPKEQP